MPNSLLWVCLVVIWLFVLVPMVIKGRAPVRTQTDATLKTRVLHSKGRALAKLRGGVAAGAHPYDPDYEPPVREYGKIKPSTTTAADFRSGDAELDDERTELEDESADAELAVENDAETVETKADAVKNEADAGAEDELDAEGDDTETDEALADDADGDGAEKDGAEGDEADLDDAEVDDAADADELAEADHDDVAELDELDDESPAPPPHRVRRKGFDPDEDARQMAGKYRIRQRVIMVLLALLALAAVVGVAAGTFGWILTGIAAVTVLGYLLFLRRTVKVEQRIRRQRMARLARSRRDEQLRAQRPDRVHRDQVPRQYRRPGALVLEIDDEDPAFDHLPSYRHARPVRQPASYHRAVGE